MNHTRRAFAAPAERLTRRRLFGLIPLPVLAGCTAAVAGPAVLRLEHTQPEPDLCFVARDEVAETTAIARVWVNGDESRCRLCDRCHVARGVCMVLVPELVADSEAGLYSIRGRQGGAR
jgi:hypothetical protein